MPEDLRENPPELWKLAKRVAENIFKITALGGHVVRHIVLPAAARTEGEGWYCGAVAAPRSPGLHGT